MCIRDSTSTEADHLVCCATEVPKNQYQAGNWLEDTNTYTWFLHSLLPHALPPPHTRPQRLPLLPTERRDDGDGVRAGGDDGRRGVEAHAADGDERRVGGHEAAPGRDAVEAARREGDALGRRAEDGPEGDLQSRLTYWRAFWRCLISLLPGSLHRGL